MWCKGSTTRVQLQASADKGHLTGGNTRLLTATPLTGQCRSSLQRQYSAAVLTRYRRIYIYIYILIICRSFINIFFIDWLNITVRFQSIYCTEFHFIAYISLALIFNHRASLAATMHHREASQYISDEKVCLGTQSGLRVWSQILF